MVMHKAEIDALARLRKAIIADVAEDFGTVAEMTEWHEDLVEAWNEFANAGVHGGKPISMADIEEMFKWEFE